MYDILQELPSEARYVFACTDLNNVPFIELSTVDGATIVCQQRTFQKQLQDMVEEQNLMRKQLAEVLQLLNPAETGKSENCGDKSPAIDLRESPIVESRRTFSAVVQGEQSIPGGSTSKSQAIDADTDRKYATDNEGFKKKAGSRSRKRSNMITGRKVGTKLKSVPFVKLAKIFVSRLEPSASVEGLTEYLYEITGKPLKVAKMTTKHPSYSSFVIVCEKDDETKLLNPDEWEEGVLVRRFYGQVNVEKQQ